jgi:hypothetical protein
MPVAKIRRRGTFFASSRTHNLRLSPCDEVASLASASPS